MRRINSSRAWVSTWIVTSAGILRLSMRVADEIEIGLRGGGKADLDLLEAHRDERVEHADLAVRAHRLDQRLVAVAQIDGTPDRSPGDGFIGPLSIGEIDWRERTILFAWIDHHGSRAFWPVLGLRVGSAQ